MRRHKIVQAVVAATIVTLSGAATSAQEFVRIGLAVPHNAAYVQFYAADTLGFYKDAGVKAELTIYRGGAASQEALSAGAADIITYFGAGVALAVSKGAKEKIVAAIDPTPHGWQFLVLANSPIKTLKDLDGKKVGVATKAGTADMFAL
jgi:NitT/TauT family transport system substrate-binding protein